MQEEVGGGRWSRWFINWLNDDSGIFSELINKGDLISVGKFAVISG